MESHGASALHTVYTVDGMNVNSFNADGADQNYYQDWTGDQRAVFQPVAVAIFAMSALWIGARGAITPEVIKLFLIGLPALFAGTWLGLKLFGRLTRPHSGKSCWRCFWRRAPC